MSPQQPPVQYAPLPAGPPRPPVGLSVAVIVIAFIYAAGSAVHAVLAFPVAAAWRDALDGRSYDRTVITLSDDLASMNVVVLVACFVVGCLWLQRSYQFARSVYPAFQPRHAIAWTWLGWLVPVVSLWFPYQIVTDVRAGTERSNIPRGMSLWWASFLVSRVLGSVATFAVRRISGGMAVTEFEAVFNEYVVATVASAVLLLVACALWVRYVREVTVLQRARTAELDLPAT